RLRDRLAELWHLDGETGHRGKRVEFRQVSREKRGSHPKFAKEKVPGEDGPRNLPTVENNESAASFQGNKILWSGSGPAGCLADSRTRGKIRPHGPVGFGQEHPAELHRRDRPS